MTESARHAKGRRTDAIDASDAASIKALQVIPGIGKSLAADLVQLGYRSVDELKGQDPQIMYERLSRISGASQDRCVLYTFRCAVYFAQTRQPDPEKLKWWNWKDRPARLDRK
jgi:Pathogenicity locus